MSIKEKADEFLSKSGLIEILNRYGNVSIVGSYKMDVMTWNDLDIYLDIADFRKNKYYELSAEILKELSPIRFDRILNIDNEHIFLGFETILTGERWNIDIWWKTKTEIDSSIMCACELTRKMEKNPEFKNAVIRIKQDLIARKLYGFDKRKIHYHSNEIYAAVFEKGILSTEEFLQSYSK